MIDINLATPALFFSCLSVFIHSYIKKFSAISDRIRNLHMDYMNNPDQSLHKQILIMKKRIRLIRYIQLFGIISFFLCVFSIFLIILGYTLLANYSFLVSIIFMFISLSFSLYEIYISTTALHIQIDEFTSQNMINQ